MKWCDTEEINNLNIVGGEPTIHPKGKEFFELMKKHNIKGSLVTNGLFDKNFPKILDPEIVTHVQISYNNSAERSIWEENLKRLKEIVPNICLRFNIGSLDDSYEDVLNVAKKYKINELSFSLIAPNPHENNAYIPFKDLFKFSKYITDLIKDAKDSGIKKFHAGVCLPLCIFDKKTRSFLISKVKFSGVCSAGAMEIVINPDLSSFPCPIMTSLGFKDSIDIPFNKLRELYDPIINRMRWQLLAKEECEKCIYFLRKRCQGGCLIYKFLNYKEEIKQLYRKQLKIFTSLKIKFK